MLFRYDASPRCAPYNYAKPNSRSAEVLRLWRRAGPRHRAGFALVDFFEPFAFMRFGLANEASQTNPASCCKWARGAPLHDERFALQIFFSPWLGVDLTSGPVNRPATESPGSRVRRRERRDSERRVPYRSARAPRYRPSVRFLQGLRRVLVGRDHLPMLRYLGASADLAIGVQLERRRHHGQPRARPTYEPNRLSRALPAVLRAHPGRRGVGQQRCASCGARHVVYILRNLSFLDFLALDHLTKRFGLPRIRFANDLGLWVLEPMGKGWLRALRPHEPRRRAERARAGIARRRLGGAVPEAPARRARRRRRRERQARAARRRRLDPRAARLQRSRRRTPILLVPQVFVWTKPPTAQGTRRRCARSVRASGRGRSARCSSS